MVAIPECGECYEVEDRQMTIALGVVVAVFVVFLLAVAVFHSAVAFAVGAAVTASVAAVTLVAIRRRTGFRAIDVEQLGLKGWRAGRAATWNEQTVCSRCHGEVSPSSLPGEACPHCGVIWSAGSPGATTS